MNILKDAKVWVAVGFLILLAACAPRRNDTAFSKNKAAEAGQTYTEDQLRAAIGSAQYDQLVAGVGADNLNLLTYGVGISNMSQMINGITGPGKLVSLMSNGPNSTKLTALEVLDLLNKLDAACKLANSSFGTDTIGKMVNMINNVSLSGMEGIKNIVHGVGDAFFVQGVNDPNGVAYNNPVSRLALMISLLDESLSVMPTLVNDLAAPRCSLPAYTTSASCGGAGGSWNPNGVFSAVGNAKLIRLVNSTKDMRDLGVIINGTTSLSNITAVMAGLNGSVYCSKGQYFNPGRVNPHTICTSNGGSWFTNCSNVAYADRYNCESNGGTWTPDGIDNMSRLINELDRVCSLPAYDDGTDCLKYGGTWRTKASKIPVIVNNITNVPNMYTIVNGLSNDGKRPQWPVGGVTIPLPDGLGLPTAHPGDLGNVFDGVDSMVATLNKLYVAADADSFGTEGMKRMAYLVNNLDTTGVFSNDTNFDDTTGGFNCVAGNFDNRLNWAFSNNGGAGAPFSGKSWATDNNSAQGGTTCSLRNDPAAATVLTQTQSAELVANLTTGGTMTFYTRTQLNSGDTLRFFIDDVLQVAGTYTGTTAWTQRPFAVTTGVHRFRWDVQRRLNSNGQVWLDTVVLPGDKGAARTAAQKTFIMLNNLYINSSLTNVADILSNATAPACISTPLSCTPTWDNGLDTLIHTVNRVEYPALITDPPRLAVTVNQIGTLQIMYDILNFMDSQASTNQLVAIMDFVETPASLPNLINALTGQAGKRTADILKNLNAAGTSNMLRILANAPNGAPVADTARLLNGVSDSIRVAEILNKLKLSSNVYNTTSSTVTITAANPAVVTWSSGSHGLVQNARVSITTTGKLPLDLFSGRVYYACPIGADNTPMNATTFTLATDQACASKVSTLGGTQSGTPTAMAGDETFFQSPDKTGGQKLAEFFNAVNSKGSGSANICNVNDNEDDFCIKNHLVRLVDDIATSSAGSTTVADIVSNLRPNAGPEGNTGVTRMVDVLFDMKDQNSLNKYTNELSNSTSEDFGRLTTFIKAMTGGNAGLNTARMVNEIRLTKMNAHVVFLLRNVNRIVYLSRMLSEMTSVDLMLQLLNDASTNINTIDTLVDTHGNGTYIGEPGVYAGLLYGAAPSGTGCATADCDLNTTDQLGRLIQMINNIYAIGNTLTLVNTVQDIGYISYLVNNVNRIKYLTDIVNHLENVDLMVKVINGADACSVYTSANNTSATDTQTNCTNPTPAGAGGVWFGVGRCITTGQKTRQTRLDCLNNGGTWYGADQVRLRNLLNGLGGSTDKGTGSKAIGNMFTLYDVMNRLGFYLGAARSAGQQVRVVRLVNSVEYCGLKPAYDKYIQYGPTCHDGAGTPRPLNFQFQEACTNAGAGYTWQAKASSTAWVAPSTIYNTCRTIAADGTYNTSYVLPTPTITNGGFFNDAGADQFDARPRLLQAMLNVDDGSAFSNIVGDVQETQKTIDMMNGTRRVGGITKLVNWMPGAVTAALINATHSAAVNRALVYMANNLDDDETETAKAFAAMIHFGIKVLPQTPQGGPPACLEFTGIGPRRLAAVLNLEAGPYIEGLLSSLGWQMAIAAMNCGWARDDGQNAGASQCTSFVDKDGASGGLLKDVGSSYNGSPSPTARQCIPARELTATYKYGNYQWGPGNTQGILSANCRSIMPNLSGGSILGITEEDRTDNIIWNGMSTTVGDVDRGIGSDACPGAGCSDMWSILKGTATGAVGWLMKKNNSKVGFPSPSGGVVGGNRPNGSSAGTLCSSNSNNGNNWQCVRCALQRGDLASNLDCAAGDSGGGTSYGRYWGTFCSGANATTGGGGTDAQRCVSNGGAWKTVKKFDSAACTLDPANLIRVGPP